MKLPTRWSRFAGQALRPSRAGRTRGHLTWAGTLLFCALSAAGATAALAANPAADLDQRLRDRVRVFLQAGAASSAEDRDGRFARSAGHCFKPLRHTPPAGM